MSDDSYRTGKHIGWIMGALATGMRELAATWPADAPDQAKEEVEQMAKFRGLSVVFGANTIDIKEPEKKRPDLQIVS